MALLFQTYFLLSILCISSNAQLFQIQLPFFGSHPSFPDEQEQQQEQVAPVKEKGKETAPLTTNFKGSWELFSQNSGVSAMHSMLLPNNKIVMYDATIWEISALKLPAGMPCRKVESNGDMDCWCHAIQFDVETGERRPLTLHTDTWCSSGALDVDGHLVGTGGDKTGSRTVRYLQACDDCDWKEDKDALKDPRWYATTVTMGDGSFVIFGGRNAFTYEYIPPIGQYNTKSYNFPFLRETSDPVENNLYPFVHLSTDGNVFIFANNRSILFDPKHDKLIRRFPDLPGGHRNYPSSGMSALLPIKLYVEEKNRKVVPAEVLVCGGAPTGAYQLAEKKIFMTALDDCARITITSEKAKWKKEKMPSPRVLGDMMILPTGDILMINGAKKGTAAWEYAKEPNYTPVLYKTKAKKGQRFEVLQASNIPRMYHSSSSMLPDARVMIAGSNTNNGYLYNVEFPTELRVEKFSPPYLDPSLAKYRPEIVLGEGTQTRLHYADGFPIQIKLGEDKVSKADIKVTMYAPAFTTHGISMNQRLVILGVRKVKSDEAGVHNIVAVAPPRGNLAPQGYYLMFVVYRGVPSKGVWVQITK
ncbi:hypothetical protein ACFE04_015920 [Oxalis oulophora]